MKTEKLHKLFLECHSVSTDTRKIVKDDMFFALKGENFNGNKYAEVALNNGAKYAIVDEAEFNNSAQTILVDNVLETLQTLATFHRDYLNKPIIALTGSNGKTTTKELINSVLSEKYITTATIGNLNNHIGVPLTLLSLTNETEIGIVEMGANHQKEIEFLCSVAKPDYGYITNFGKAHLEGFGGVEGVIKGKSEMYDYLIFEKKHIFVNANDPIQVKKTENANIYTFGNQINQCDVTINFIEAKPFVKCSFNNIEIQSQLIGDYNFNNIAIAITIGKYFKIDDSAIKRAIESYIPTNNRSQIIEKATNKIILDAYNANPSSMHAALLNFEKQSGKKTAILGDMFELGENAKLEHQNITDLALSLDIDEIILIGENFYRTKSNKAKQFKSFDYFKNDFDFSKINNRTLLIKGSRGMALERLLDLL
ncbi:UDP-N-acetylmuramoyl-tripeptide--D-alanyl-D-alanine ligase [Algibacter marinivivus]|uniref:UDP-N-acetylmuramoyl-tripeptide--D-alanyl-D-alanine ligase n=1 Tax=Algibacter marinivivus TaxID=2100723 RepID=A0A2U2X6P1_9FLAO|nr:UDP-N-acetylmuramoyl-tripeptide--D-alanyl-D-alanine ligase [Algibacter marinivivus]PWH83465.1 UDP-N-acetylmuramoyl-tripeptide--D-alanyl-D-alanine ligase [Algibacter marinivivus]